MCLTIPGKIIALEASFATVDYGEYGARERVNTSLVEAKVGNYVLVQGGFAIKILSEKDARESLKAWEIISEELRDSGGIV